MLPGCVKTVGQCPGLSLKCIMKSVTQKNNNTCLHHVACGMHFPDEELEPDDGVDDNHKEDQQSDVEQGNHGFNNGIQNHL